MGLKIEILSMLSELLSKLKETDKNNSCKNLKIQHVHVKYTGFSLVKQFVEIMKVDREC